MKTNKQNRPSFINGLLQAKKILISLKQRKLKELQSINEHSNKNISVQSPKQFIKQQSKEIQQVRSQIYKAEQSKKKLLIKKINKIGKELYENYLQIEQDQVIFQKLAEYYSQNIGIVQQNQRYKRKNYKYAEIINFYKEKIQKNYKTIQQNKENQYKFIKMVQQTLQQYFLQQKQRSNIQIMPKTQTKIDIFSIDLKEQQNCENDKVNLELNWRNLSQATEKKAVIKKSKVVEQDICKSFYNSQIYNI